jgi:hypothetical protein
MLLQLMIDATREGSEMTPSLASTVDVPKPELLVAARGVCRFAGRRHVPLPENMEWDYSIMNGDTMPLPKIFSSHLR